ncbi:MAG TPA: DUF3362 domain-containing protein, partial [Candidatus Lokiarchaeia archaeon]
NKKQNLRLYFMICHPGDNISEVLFLKDTIIKKKLVNFEQFQVFTPTPMTVSTCMYWTGLNPFTLGNVNPVYDYNTKKKMKRIMLQLHAKMKGSLDASSGF